MSYTSSGYPYTTRQNPYQYLQTQFDGGWGGSLYPTPGVLRPPLNFPQNFDYSTPPSIPSYHDPGFPGDTSYGYNTTLSCPNTHQPDLSPASQADCATDQVACDNHDTRVTYSDATGFPPQQTVDFTCTSSEFDVAARSEEIPNQLEPQSSFSSFPHPINTPFLDPLQSSENPSSHSAPPLPTGSQEVLQDALETREAKSTGVVPPESVLGDQVDDQFPLVIPEGFHICHLNENTYCTGTGDYCLDIVTLPSNEPIDQLPKVISDDLHFCRSNPWTYCSGSGDYCQDILATFSEEQVDWFVASYKALADQSSSSSLPTANYNLASGSSSKKRPRLEDNADAEDLDRSKKKQRGKDEDTKTAEQGPEPQAKRIRKKKNRKPDEVFKCRLCEILDLSETRKETFARKDSLKRHTLKAQIHPTLSSFFFDEKEQIKKGVFDILAPRQIGEDITELKTFCMEQQAWYKANRGKIDPNEDLSIPRNKRKGIALMINKST